MRGVIPPRPQYAFMAWRLGEHRDKFTFTTADTANEVKDPPTLKFSSLLLCRCDNFKTTWSNACTSDHPPPASEIIGFLVLAKNQSINQSFQSTQTDPTQCRTRGHTSYLPINDIF
jgi:hypothetical protein